ncbi:hypothetical protein QBC39DRAFT_346869 [Podospora conica]|nr:hypothetical protein QBC39DRAFT_346869 [Schizothecium conicum]
MKTAAALLLSLFATAGLGQGLGLPDCAGSCLTTAIAASGCSSTDISCLCAYNIASFTTPCLVSTCAPSDLAVAQGAIDSICVAVAESSTAVTSPAASTASLPSTFTTTTRADSPTFSYIPPSPTPIGDEDAVSSVSGGSGSPSSGADIGIGIGIALGVVALVVAAWFVFKHRKKKNTQAAGQPPEATMPELDAKDSAAAAAAHYRPELEADTNQVPAEMGGHQLHPPVELDGQQPPHR